jgi:isoleucyl-tRNA synthetase
LATVSKLIAPVAPFYADRLYQDLDKTTQKEQCSSVHLAYFPDVNSAFIDHKLEQKMQRAQRIVSLVLSIRKKEKIKVRQPLQRVLIPVLDAEEKREIEEISALIAAEVNVKSIEILDDASSILVKEIKPNFKTLGPRFGKDMKAIADAINGFEATQISALERDGSLTIEISGKNIILDASDVVIQSKDIEGWSVASEQGVTVALDSTLSESLVLEGIARELVNRVQNLRKDKGFEVTDTIALTIEKHSRLQEAVQANESYVMSEILAQKIQFIDKNADGETLSFDDIETMISIHKPTTI